MDWLFSSKKRQKENRKEVLLHLRQISFQSNPSELQRFLQETLTPSYIGPQPEVLCLLYDELNIQRCKELLNMFSPIKSVAPCPR